MRHLALVLMVVFLAACVLEDLQHEGRYCSAEWPCIAGQHCVNGACISDSAGLDARRDTIRTNDLKTGEGDLTSKVDRGADSKPPVDLTLKPDQPPVPDAGCPAGQNICGTQCVDTTTSVDHCGGCSKPCPTGFADRCEGGKCHCGSLGPLCSGGLSCVKGACACVSGSASNCKGCCQNNTCQPGTSTKACGAGGASCKLCLAGPCQLPVCNKGGFCGTVPAPNGISCSVGTLGGRCYLGACCTGCWSGAKCEPGTATMACGKYGLPCKPCIGFPIKKCSNGVCL
jgi:hypothetical protein